MKLSVFEYIMPFFMFVFKYQKLYIIPKDMKII